MITERELSTLWKHILECQEHIVNSVHASAEDNTAALAEQYDNLVRNYVEACNKQPANSHMLKERIEILQQFDSSTIALCKKTQQGLIAESSKLRNARLGIEAYAAGSQLLT